MDDQQCLDFDGFTYDASRDEDRLGRQLRMVKRLMADGKWRTLPEIAAYADGSVAAVSARLRDLRKSKFGSYAVERRYIANGVWEYRVGK